MRTLTSAKVKDNFGQTIDLAKAGEPITITQHAKPQGYQHWNGHDL